MALRKVKSKNVNAQSSKFKVQTSNFKGESILSQNSQMNRLSRNLRATET